MTDLIKRVMPMNLQFFAEGDGNGGASDGVPAGTEGDNGNPTGQAGEGAGTNGQGQSVEFSPEQQEIMNSTISTRISQEHDKWEKSTAQRIKEAIEDYKKKSGMSQEELDQIEQDEKDQKLNQLQGQLNQRDREDHAREVGEKLGLSSELVNMVVADTDDETDKRLDALSKAVNKLVQSGVEDRLKGTKTPQAGSSLGNEKGSYGERLAKEFKHEAPQNSYFAKN